ncbi:fungal-specific transcription factor, partial [Mucor lusitanicus]
HQQKAHQPREKRLKVSRACFTCRVKKIKCDGVQPCMQCKARRRPCSFSKDGTVDETQQSHDANHSSMEDDRQQPHPSPPTSAAASKKRPFSMEDGYQHANDTSLEQQKSKQQDGLNRTLQQLERLSMMWPGEGKEGRWLVDINLLFNGAEETALNEPAQPNSASFLNLNNNLLALFFRHRHTIFPILPKSIFYRLLEHRDALITPLLLNSMYCNAAHYSHEDAAEADSYFRKAQALLDTYIDTPNLSLVISLCLLSTFESNRYGTGPPIGRSKARIYRDMACRMCHDLKLHKRYSFHNTGATPDDIELRKRAYWVCYCLDKVQSLVTGKPYLLSSKDIDIDFPVVLGTDDSSEFDVNTCFVEHIKLMQISERVLQLEIPDRQAGMLRSPENEQLVLDLDGQLLYWLRNLPPSLQWTPLNTNNDMIPTQPPQNALVAHLHLVFNYLEISVLQPIASTSLSSSPASLIIQQRCASVATNLTQLTCAMAEQPAFIISFAFMAEAIMSALRVHIMNCADEKTSTARHARFMFQRSLRSMRAILQHRVLDRIQDFATTIEKALVDADTGNSSSRNSSPKIHVLSPIIPRTAASSTSIHNTIAPMPMDPYANMDERWPARANNSNGLMPYGLVSPTSSTASAPLEKAAMSRDEDISRPHAYSHLSAPHAMTTAAPLMDPYSRPASFQMPATTSASTPTAWKSPAVSPNHSKSASSQPTPSQEQQQMEMYSNIWSRTSLENGLQQFSSDHLDNSFINSTRQHIQQEKKEKQHFEAATSAALQATNSFHTAVSSADSSNTAVGDQHTMTADSELYSLWDQQANKNNATSQQQQQTTMLTPQPQPITGSRYGLGVYASAQQHHTDVIRQHMPDLKPSNSNRPVLLNHHGQVVVAGASQSNHSMH